MKNKEETPWATHPVLILEAEARIPLRSCGGGGCGGQTHSHWRPPSPGPLVLGGAGPAFAGSPHPWHTQAPTPVSQPHSLRHSKTHKSLPGCPNKGLESSAGTEPLSLRRPDKRDRGSESARSDRLVHHAPWPRACSSEGSSSAPAPSPPLLPLSTVLLAGRSTTQPSGIISRRNLL